MNKFFPSFLIALCLAFPALAQDDLLEMLEAEQQPSTEYVTATFKGTKVINGQSTELPGPGVLQFMILHRFGSFNDDFLYNFFGLENADIRFSFDYSFNRWLNVGLGRSSFQKTYDGFVKLKLLRQSTGKRVMPVSVVWFSSAYVNTLRFEDDLPHSFQERLAYSHQLVIGRKFTERLSLALTPSLVHFNLRDTRAQPNDVYALGFGGRFKITNRVSFNAEYFAQLPANTRVELGQEVPMENSLSLGFDIETGGHVFQIHLTNSRGVIDPQFIAGTPGSWANGDIYLGFNISRVFTIKEPKQPEPKF